MKYLLSILYFTYIFANNTPLYEFIYVTDSENAGGGPFVFDGNYPYSENRRDVHWSLSNLFNSEWQGDVLCDCSFQTNGTLTISHFGCPEFNNTVTVTDFDNGEYGYPNLNGCYEDQVFQGYPPLDTAYAVYFAAPNYDIVNENATHIFDATSKLNWSPTYFSRDTLIMTDIEFFEENGGGIKVKQWWFLMPPYLNTDIEHPFVFPESIDDSINCTNSYLFTCDNYIESMKNFHSKNVSSFGFDSFINPIVQSTYGFHHYDIPNIHVDNWENNWVSQLTDDHLLLEYQDNGYLLYQYNYPMTIYVKGGPVRIHGTYKGQYTVFTDEYTAYNRHAWGSNLLAVGGGSRVDTLWNNIWITDDIVNSDALSNNNLLNAQPNEFCENGSNNILGLVSGANVYVANTQANGARNRSWDQDIHIHAHITALNESFAVQYWQNTISTFGNTYSNPPYADGQGQSIYGNGGTTDYRGTIYLWGGIAQKFRGYTKRNNPGPYMTNDIGMETNYNYDCNLLCVPPPNYPGFGPGCIDSAAFNYNPFATFDDGNCEYTQNGDLNGDEILDVVDIIVLIDIILSGINNFQADLNEDGDTNVVDIVALVNLILGEE